MRESHLLQNKASSQQQPRRVCSEVRMSDATHPQIVPLGLVRPGHV